MGKLIWDTSRWPLVCVKLQAGFTDADIDALVVASEEVVRRKQHYAVAMDMLESGVPTAKQRSRVSDMIDKNRDDMRRYYVCNALAITSAPLRTTMNALSLLVKPPFPIRLVATMDEARSWCEAQLRRVAQESRAVGS